MALISWDDVINKYPQPGRGPGADEVSSVHIAYAEAELNGRLGSKYTVPFSSNNMTAKELAVDLTLLRLKVFKSEDKEAVKTAVDERIARLLDGSEQMYAIDGTLLSPDVVTAWSSTHTYPPTFGMGDIEDMQVSSAQLADEEADRG
jgi:hypothetical protein